MTTPRFAAGLRDAIDDVDVILSDIWGVVHNGKVSFPAPCDALRQCRQRGITVILITNSPRPSGEVRRQLQQLGVADDVYDGIVSSGDVTRGYIADHAGKSAFHLGPARDKPLFDGLNVTFAPAETADYIAATGLFNDQTETPDDYRTMLTQVVKRSIPMLCANPDIVVEHGDRLIYCAGALAELYMTLGGPVIFGGKPHRPIYERGLALAQDRRGKSVDRARVLAIGDSVRTDLEGANGFGVRCLFVTGGIHAGDLGSRDNPDHEALGKLFREATRPPVAVMTRLVW